MLTNSLASSRLACASWQPTMPLVAPPHALAPWMGFLIHATERISSFCPILQPTMPLPSAPFDSPCAGTSSPSPRSRRRPLPTSRGRHCTSLSRHSLPGRPRGSTTTARSRAVRSSRGCRRSAMRSRRTSRMCRRVGRWFAAWSSSSRWTCRTGTLTFCVLTGLGLRNNSCSAN